MNTTQNLLHKFIGEHAQELEVARKEDNYKRPLGSLIRQNIAGTILKSN